MDLLPFQVEASGQIAERFGEYMEDPLTITRSGLDIIPFYQNLSSITGSGKTLILADTVEQIRSRLPIETDRPYGCPKAGWSSGRHSTTSPPESMQAS